MALSGDGLLVASGSDDQTVGLWETASVCPPASLVGHTNAVWGVALSEDGGAVASASFDGTVWLWDTATGEHHATMQGHDGRVCTVALDGGELLAASGGVDGTVRIWDAPDGALRHTLRADRQYERLDITGLSGVTEAQREALLALGAAERDTDPR